MDATTTYIKATGLRKEYKRASGESVSAIDGIDLEIRKGEFVAVIGPSGCGKTTFLRCIAGLESPDGGEIAFGETAVFSSRSGVNLPPEKRDIAMLFQSYALWPHMTVLENVVYPLKLKGVSRDERLRRGQEMLHEVQCDGLAGQYPNQISGGQQQRVALARALVTDNALVLFDEPLSNIDTQVRRQMRDQIRTLHRQFGFTAVYVTHDQEEAFSLADTLVVLEKGRIAQMGDPRDVYLKPDSRYVAQFMGEVNLIEAKVTRVEGEMAYLSTPVGEMRASAVGRSDLADYGLFAFRPQKCRLGSPHPDSGSSTANVLRGELQDKKFLGAYTEVKVGLAGGVILSGTTLNDVEVEIGGRVDVEIDPADIFPLAQA
ncbi:Iron(III) transport system ATP-binding protein OS=Castellaniella defragrans OX=75697 GN=HNR28_000885 PE=4 SV=1 [Castellaniella defragrans]